MLIPDWDLKRVFNIARTLLKPRGFVETNRNRATRPLSTGGREEGCGAHDFIGAFVWWLQRLLVGISPHQKVSANFNSLGV